MDKCSIGLVYSKDPHDHELPWGEVGALIGWVHSVRDNEFASISGGYKGTYKRYKPPSALTRAKQPLATGNALRCLYGCHKGTYRAWIGMNPALSQMGELNFHLQCMFEQGFETLRCHGALAECEFFVDVDDAHFADYLYLDTALRSAHQGFVSDGTMYLGSRHGRRSATIYDKAKQLEEVKAISLSSPRLRIEGKVRGSALRLKDVATVPNPFATTHVVDKKALAKIASPAAAAFQQFVAWGVSSQKAYQLLTKTQKAEMVAVLNDARPEWWNPAGAWQRVLDHLGWMDTLSLAGMTGEYLPLGPAAYTSNAVSEAVEPIS